jgi:hypothetical protein
MAERLSAVGPENYISNHVNEIAATHVCRLLCARDADERTYSLTSNRLPVACVTSVGKFRGYRDETMH